MENSELPEEIAVLIKSAEAGNPEDQFNLGQKYRLGQGVIKNDRNAFYWYKKSADKENVRGLNALGVMYQNGFGVEKNFDEAKILYQKAIEQGYPPAMSNMGSLYQYGQGVEKNEAEAFSWYIKAAELENMEAQGLVGWAYQTGLGVEKNDSEAFIWYHKAAKQGYDFAISSIGWMYQNGIGVEQNDSEALIWYHKAADLGYAPAQHAIGWMYQAGRGVIKNDSEAFIWYSKAAEKNDARAQFNIGLMYMYGLAVEKNYAQAKEMFRQAATNSAPEIRFKSIEFQDQVERYELSSTITDIRKDILNQLKLNISEKPTMTHYTSLKVGGALLLEESPLRLGHINALNDPNEGKLLWRYLGQTPVEGKPAFVGCYLLDDDSLNMWRFYSKNNQNDDACGCAITFNTENFFNFNLMPELTSNVQESNNIAFSNTGKYPQESSAFYRIIYIDEDMNIRDEDKQTLVDLFTKLKEEVSKFIDGNPSNERLQQLSRLLGPLPYLLKDADYESEKEHRIIITHLEYGAKEIKTQDPIMVDGIPNTAPRLFLELHRVAHLQPVKHVTLGPKAPHQEMMASYWHHKLASEFPDQLKAKPDFYVRASKCAYK